MELKGTVTIKKIKGKDYYIHQYREGSSVKNRSLSEDEAYSLIFQLNYQQSNNFDELMGYSFKTQVQFGNNLHLLLKKYKKYKHRYLFENIKEFLGDEQKLGKVLALYGLRRTGKTTLIFQSIIDSGLSGFAQSAYIKINKGDKFADLMSDLDFLSTHGFKYIYIDEVTLLEDFLSMASTLSDIYGLRSKIVLSGTDSLGFLISKYHELFDRVILLHTTYISFKEFSEVLGIDSIDTYIEYGGLMSIEGDIYNQEKIIEGEHYNEYVDSAIAHNIEHSLKYYDDGSHFSSLFDLYEKKELTNVINRLVEDTNHRFAISVIEESFKSHDFGSLKNLIKKNLDKQVSISLDEVDEDKVVKLLMKELSIINKEKQTHKIDDKVIQEIDSYLDALDLCKTIDVISAPSFALNKRKVFIQPGLRYAQAKALLEILMNQESVRALPLIIKNFIEEKLLSDIKGKMLEEIVLYQTFVSNKDTFKLMFPIGEIDMVVLNNKEETSDIFEIKYSKDTHEKQYQFLNDAECERIITNAYYPIHSKTVLYRGENTKIGDINYLNVENYLKNL